MCVATGIYLIFCHFYDIYSIYVATQIYNNFIKMSIIIITNYTGSYVHVWVFCRACIVDPGYGYSMKFPNGPVTFPSP